MSGTAGRPAVLVLNTGSSSIKAGVFEAGKGDRPILSALAERLGTAEAHCSLRDPDGSKLDAPQPPEDSKFTDTKFTHEAMLAWLIPLLRQRSGVELVAAGHRIVHGGAHYSRAVAIDDSVVAALNQLIPMARTHQPYGLAAVEAVRKRWPELPQVACFDTAFHATISHLNRMVALSRPIIDKGVRRYGFHGLSYAWIASHLPDILGARAKGRVIVAHLGNGASLCGLIGCESRATSMGFSTLEGLMMGERPGTLDPGIVLFLLEELGMNLEEVRHLLFKESGLKGVSGLSNDMRTLLASESPFAKEAVALYIHRAVREIGAVAAEIGGLDALIFTAGIGEHAAPIRAGIVEGCSWLGAELDPAANAADATLISPPGAKVTAYVIPTNEEAVIARETRAALDLNP